MSNHRFSPRIRRDLILRAAIVVTRRPGGWFTLTRALIAVEAGCSEALVSRYLGNMHSVRKAIMKVALKESIDEIISQSIAAYDGYARK